jgi:hypothetical protein
MEAMDMKIVTIEKQFVTANEAALLGGFAPGTLANMRHQKKGCQYYKRGSKVLYDRAEFEAWLKENPVKTIDSI